MCEACCISVSPLGKLLQFERVNLDGDLLLLRDHQKPSASNPSKSRTKSKSMRVRVRCQSSRAAI
jgi:hypothetical protein